MILANDCSSTSFHYFCHLRPNPRDLIHKFEHRDQWGFLWPCWSFHFGLDFKLNKMISFREIIGFRWGLPNKSSHKLDLVWINASNLHRKFIFGKIDYVNYVLSCRGNVRLSFSDSDSLFIPLKAALRAQNQSVIGPPTRFLGFNLTFQKLQIQPCQKHAALISNRIFKS